MFRMFPGRLAAAMLCTGALFLTFLPGSDAASRDVKNGGGTFSNTTPMTINTATSSSPPIPGSLYPSTIEVTGMAGNITRVAVTLHGVTHEGLADLDMLLVSPTGEKFIFLADSGGLGPTDDRNLTLADDGATTVSPSQVPNSGTYKPTAGDPFPEVFPSPAPAGPYAQPPTDTFASVFNGRSPNGTWSLFAVDDGGTRFGQLGYGWSLTITTNGQPETFSNFTTNTFADTFIPSSPYGTAVSVSGLSGVVTNLTVRILGFTHTDPQDVDVYLVSPNGSGVIVMSDIGSSSNVSNIDLTFTDSAASFPGSTLMTGTWKPQNLAGFPDFFPSPAPFRPIGENPVLSRLNGISPNGDWRLFVVDGRQGDSGEIAGGWSLEIETGPAAPPPPASCAFPTFIASSPTGFPAGSGPADVVIEDFNGDMIPDTAIANQISNDVTIQIGVGDGTFAAPTSVPVGSGPFSLVAGMFNADSNVDLAVANSASNNVSILLGNGNGTFQAPTSFLAGASPISIATGDVNGDSNADLVVANFGSFFLGTVSVFLGNGNGGFTAAPQLRTRTQPSAVAVANLNGDSFQDIVVTNFGSDSISVFHGNGSGGFQLFQNLNSSSGPVSVEVTSLGTDPYADLIVANYNNDTLTTCNGSVTGAFSCNTQQVAGANPIAVTTADFLGNGLRSRAVALSGTDQILVESGPFAVGQYPNSIAAKDLNGDSLPDIVTANYGSDNMSVLLNNCAVSVGNRMDFNGDRRSDYAVYRGLTSAWYIQSLSPTQPWGSFSTAEDKLVPADYNGDGITDMGYYRPVSGLWFVVDRFRNPIYFMQFGLPDDIPVPADFDGDSRADLAVWRPSTGTWYIRRSSDNSVEVIQFGLDGDKPVQADFDGDGNADVAVFRPSNGVWYIRRSSDLGFRFEQFGTAEDKTVPADFDGDGIDDIAVWRPSTGVWYVLRSTDGGFSATSFGVSTDMPQRGDFDGDGRYDFAVWRPAEGNWWVLRSSDGATSVFNYGSPTDEPIPNVYVR